MSRPASAAPSPREAPAGAAGPFDFLAEPFLWLYGGFLLVMASLGFAHPTLHSAAMAARWPVLGVMAAVGIGMAIARRTSPRSAAFVFLGIFLVVATLSSAYSTDRWYSFQRAGSLWLLFGAATIGLSAYCRSPRELMMTTDLLWWIGAALVVAGFVFRMGSAETDARYGGLYDRATGAGTYGALFLPIAVYQARHRFRGVMSTVGWLVICLLFLQIVLAAARTALAISSLVCLALWFEYYGRRAAAAIVVFAVVLPIPFVMSSRYVERLQSGSTKIIRAESIGTFTGRLDRWAFGAEQFLRRPAAGHGFGVSRTLASFEDPMRFRLQPGDVFNLHSDQIETLVDLGLVGFVCFSAFWLALVAEAGRLVLAASGPARAIGMAYLGGAFYVFVDTFMHGGFLAAGGGISSYSWSLLALFVASRRLTPALGLRTAQRRPKESAKAIASASALRPTPAASEKPSIRDRLPSARSLPRLRAC